MIYIFGDSHANFNFKNIKYQNVINNYQNSITMHRIGRDKLNLSSYGIKNNDIIIYQCGEVDCRCHIGKQLLLGRQLNKIIYELTNKFIKSIKDNLKKYDKLEIIICCIPPPMNQEYYENLHGPITHQFPFVGTESERINYTILMNNKLQKYCKKNNFYFLNYYDDYKNINGNLKVEISDNICHINKNDIVLQKLYNIIDNL
jgi:hypothetical protein